MNSFEFAVLPSNSRRDAHGSLRRRAYPGPEGEVGPDGAHREDLLGIAKQILWITANSSEVFMIY